MQKLRKTFRRGDYSRNLPCLRLLCRITGSGEKEPLPVSFLVTNNRISML